MTVLQVKNRHFIFEEDITQILNLNMKSIENKDFIITLND